jgi:hypothetical protein
MLARDAVNGRGWALSSTDESSGSFCMKELWGLIAALLLAAQGLSAQAAELTVARELAVAGRFADAMESVERILGADPDSAEAQFVKGFVLAQAGREEQAQEIFLELTRRHPGYPEPFNNLAVIYARQGDYERSAEILKQALRTHSSYRTAYENLTQIYGKMASRAYDRALGQEASAPGSGPPLELLSGLNSSPGLGSGPPMAVQSPESASGSEAPAPSEIAAEAAATTDDPAVTATPDPIAVANEFDASVLVALVEGWARAWSEQRAEDYIDFYSRSFRPVGGVTRTTWAAQRRERITRPRFIQVEVDSVGVRQIGDERAQVRFIQSYRSDSFQDRVVKTLDLVRESGGWKIAREEASS